MAKIPGVRTPQDQAIHSGAQKITQGSLNVGATQERTTDWRTDTSSAPTSQKDAKDPTQSAHYRLWGPGFLDMSLVPEEQEPATPTKSPAQVRDTEGINLDAIASLQADEHQKLIKNLQGLAASRQEPTRQPPVHTATTSAEEEIQWEQMGARQPPVSEDPQARPPSIHNPVSTKPSV